LATLRARVGSTSVPARSSRPELGQSSCSIFAQVLAKRLGFARYCCEREFPYIEANQNFIPNYGDRYRHGEKISTGFAESAVNQVVSKRMVKKQQMRWTEAGAHNLLQVRTKVLNDQLRETFVRWYPRMQTEQKDRNSEEGRVAPGLKCSPLTALLCANLS
jgi:hypothetical protein